MNITTRIKGPELAAGEQERVEERFAAIARYLGADSERALLELDLEPAPAEGRSATPYRLVANLRLDGTTYHAEAVKPSPESAADRVRSELDNELRKVRGREKRSWRRGAAAVKNMLRGWR